MGATRRTAGLLVGLLMQAGCGGDISAYGAPLATETDGGPSGDGGPNTEAGSDGDETGSDGTPPQRDPDVPGSTAIPTGLRRLSRREVDATIADLFGEATGFATTYLPPDPPSRFDNDHALQTVSAAHIEGAMLLADAVVRWVDEEPSRRQWLVACDVSPAADHCVAPFVERFGRRVLRRPLEEAERDRLLDLPEPGAGTDEAIDTIVASLLQDPEFLYRFEIGESAALEDGVVQLTDWEVGSRLAFLIWGRGPDDALLDRAASGGLSTTEDVLAAAEEMLEHDAARTQADNFHGMWLGFDRVGTGDLAGRMRTESAALVERILFDERRPWSDLLTADETFIDGELAEHYGLPWPGGEQPRWIKDPTGRRRGLLAHGSVLSAGAKFGDTSPTARGKFVVDRLLCSELQPPSGVNVDLPPPAATPLGCKSDRYEALLHDECGICHAQLDPIGMGLENYDATGRWRDNEVSGSQCPIDGIGELPGFGEFSGPAELGALLANSDDVRDCLITNYVRFATGRTDVETGDATTFDDRPSDLGGQGLRFSDVVLAMVRHPSFLLRKDADL